MNDVCEIWSLPWHGLQRSLAKAITARASANRDVARKFANFKSDEMQDSGFSGSSWLGRALQRGDLLLPL
ncbi:MAG TPA: hypothetical protein VNW26_08040 [Steroidobacteraceae bacterium]|nr:hypothetical protein [Steroidobacteraceae bacterium]